MDADLAALPVVMAAGRLRIGEVLGSVSEAGLTRASARGRADRSITQAGCVEPPLPCVGIGQSLAACLRDLDSAGGRCAAVLEEGTIVSVLSRTRLRVYLRAEPRARQP